MLVLLLQTFVYLYFLLGFIESFDHFQKKIGAKVYLETQLTRQPNMQDLAIGFFFFTLSHHMWHKPTQRDLLGGNF